MGGQGGDRVTLGVFAVTLVWLLYGAGGQSTSTGIDEIADKARNIPGVDAVNVREWQERARVVDEIMAAPADARIIIGGYSCGLNSATEISRTLWERGRAVATVVGIQQSLWCGGSGLESNVTFGGSVFNSACAMTGGLGCKPLEAAPSFQGQIVNVDLPLSHQEADNDPQAQAYVLAVIAATAWDDSLTPPPDRPPPPGVECRWAWSSARGWAVLCGRP